MVVYIPIYHCTIKLEQIQTNKLLIGVHFHFAIALSQYCNCKKEYKRLDSMVIFPWNFAQVKKQPWKIIFSLKLSISFEVVKFISNVLKTFVNTSCYNNDENCDFFKLWFFFSLKM